MAAAFLGSQRLTGINPPLPRSSSCGSEGSRLLTLIRQLEQKERDADRHHVVPLVEGCVEVLTHLVASCQRKGLLGEDRELAEQVLAASVTSSSRKRGRHGAASGQLSMHDNSSLLVPSADADAATTTSALDASLVLQGLVRVMAWNVSSDQCSLMVLVGDYCTAASEYLQARQTSKSQPSRCHLAEFDLLNRFPLVTSLQSFLQNVFDALQPASDGLYTIGDENKTAAVSSCFRASSSLIRLFTTRLSRSSLDGLATVSWQALAVTDTSDVPLGAAILLSTLPMQKTRSADAWMQVWHESANAIQSALAALAPVVDVSMPSGSSDDVPAPLQSWIHAVHRCPSEEGRLESFRQVMTSLVQVHLCLLGDYHPSLPSTLIVQFDVTAHVDLIETILSFGSSAEAVYFGTKKRLRAEVVGSGALSTNGVAEIANSIKVLGLKLMSCFVQAVGGASLLPFSDRLYRIVSIAVRTSCSGPLRSAMEPLVALDANNQRWLQCSISARMEAVRTFECCLLSFGCQLSCTSDSNPSDFDNTLTLVAGSLIEQFQIANAPDASAWGSISERSQLVEACARCIEAALVSSGEFLIDSTRLLLDSVIHTCLQALVEGANAATLASHVRTAILSVGTAGVTTCWRSGASSALNGSLEDAISACQGDRDLGVTAAASCARAACGAVSTTRVPALSVVVPTSNDQASFASRILSPDGLVERLETARVEAILRASERNKGAEQHNRKTATDSRTTTSPPVRPTSQPPIRNSPPEKSAVSMTPRIMSSSPEERKKHSAPTPETQLISHESAAPVSDTAGVSSKATRTDDTDADDDDDFPMIVDAEPDEDDVD